MKKKTKKKATAKKLSSNSHEITKKKKGSKRKWWKKLLSFFIVCCAIGVFAVFAFCIYIVASCGEFDPNALANQDQTIIYDSEDNIISKLGMEKRESVTYDKLPQVLVDAIIATEDSRYFEHNGVDGARFLKASLGQLFGNSSAGGASTLTMQVVKNNLTSTEQTITRKFKDVYLAVFFMEKKYTKEEILEFYVNDSLLGGNVYGVEEASKYYFGKSVSELSLPEAALIAGLFQSPNGYNPYYYPEKAANRRATVLKLMVKHGYITQEEADIANAVDVSSLLVGTKEENNYQGYIDTVVAEVKKKTKLDPALVSMEIHTTMDASIQNGINKILAGDGYTWKDDKVQAGISIVDVKTGAITAIGTGRNRTGERQWNYATQSYRQPGSTAKPIFAYAPGFEFDNFSTYQLFTDEAWSYTDGTEIGNWDSGYKGLMTLRDALSISRNIPALKAFQTVQKDVGNKKIVEFVEGLGIDLENDVAYESYSIGGLSSGVTTLQMAAAYAAFANGGNYTEPYTVKSITYRDTGETIEFEVKKTQAMKDSTAYLITNVLEYAAHYGFSGGTGSYRGTVAAKTGTSNFDEATLQAKGLPASAVNDLWTVAYTPQYSIALWYGYDEISSEYYSTSGTPKDNLMAAIMKYIPVTTDAFTKPSSVVEAEVELESWPAMKPSEYTPDALRKTEYFISGTEPTEVSPRFAKLNDVTNLKASQSGSGIKLTWEYKKPDVLTEEYLNKYFSQSVFGNSSNRFLQERLSYNNDILGGQGFGIYIKSGGNLSEVGFTTEKSYTYQGGSGNVELMVKAEYRNFKNNASDGVSVKATASGSTNTGDSSSNQLTLELSEGKDVSYSLGKYLDSGVTVLYNHMDVTSKADITYVLDGTPYSSQTELENAVNSITSAKKITIKYEVKYKADGAVVTKSISKNVTLS
ncbi:MAG: transglycosylase domain-containing protein [Erysipelotrichaceae bacterium]|nr:transglycosylase domain-containing protein [Erysipelotrichaceae bacterium]